MPVVDGILVPRTPLSVAELSVDYLGHYDHVTRRRQIVEQAARPAARRLVTSVVDLGVPSMRAQEQLTDRLAVALVATARFGHRQARAEIAALREHVRAELVIRDAGQHARAAGDGLPGVLGFLRERATAVAVALGVAAMIARDQADETDDDLVRLAVAQAVEKALHNHVLELVGEALNLGRAAGALTLDTPPEFAMRSEQLDKATCDACTRLHGTIVEVGSPSFYEYLPPAGCYGGGRCRGIYVYGDVREQVRGPETEPGPQPPLAPVPPVEFPRRRAA